MEVVNLKCSHRQRGGWGEVGSSRRKNGVRQSLENVIALRGYDTAAFVSRGRRDRRRRFSIGRMVLCPEAPHSCLGLDI